MASILADKRHTKAFEEIAYNPDHPGFMKATQHAAAYAIGLPIQPTVLQGDVVVRIVRDLPIPDDPDL